ncbi:MAG: NAD(P)-binding protein [Ideonella sp.]|nr:NAD(P)-binding protein [Ideonella sp.]
MRWPYITRRDFLEGVALGALAPALVAQERHQAVVREEGQTDAARHNAHLWRDAPDAHRASSALEEEGLEDLVVVGAGLSGLAAAWWFQQLERRQGREPRILLLEAGEHLGGHAHRNEFVSRSGERLVGYGGSQSLDSPSLFSPAVHTVLQGVGIDLKRFDSEFFDHGWHERHGVKGQALVFEPGVWPATQPVVLPPRRAQAQRLWAAALPMAPQAQSDLLRLLNSVEDVLPQARSPRQRRDALARISYRHFLLRVWRVHPQVVQYFQQDTEAYFGVGIDQVNALDAWAAGLPGFAGLQLGEQPEPRLSPSAQQLQQGTDRYVYHFPDGNHGVARALLRSLNPAALPGRGLESLVDTPLNMAALQAPDSAVRLRLQHTVVQVQHEGPVFSAPSVRLEVLDAQGQRRQVRARRVVLACWHRAVARMSDELPEAQRQALADQVKTPLIYANVLLSNWRPFARAGWSGLRSVGGFWPEASLDFPVNVGAAHASPGPDHPILLHLAKVVLPAQAQGLPPRQQASQGRQQLEDWKTDDLLGPALKLLRAALGPYGFSDQDVEAVTFNRWAHGYAYEYMHGADAYWPQGPLPCEQARQGWGRVAIANSDAGAYAYAHSAIDQATRAISELLPEAELPRWTQRPGPYRP